MPEWFTAIKEALPVVMALALVIWMAIVYHGDSRWLKRGEAVDKDGNVRWPSHGDVDATRALVLGQNDTLANHNERITNHEERLTRHEDRDETVLGLIDRNLTSINQKMDDMLPRIVRLEARSENRRKSDKTEQGYGA